MGRSADQPRVRQGDQTQLDDTGCHFLHVDMDAFFASVEIRRNPDLRGKPVVVGGPENRGVVAAASYEARKYGIRSAMPMSRALRLCPHAVVVGGNHADYGAVSREVMAILRDVTPLVQPLSLDEAFLDIRGAIRLLGTPRAIAAAIRARVERELGLTCSVGVASVMFVAKIASTRCKPDGMMIVPADRVLDFLRPLPVSALWGVGPRTDQRLRALGIQTIADVAQARFETLRSNIGVAAATHLRQLAMGIDNRPVTPERVEKSIGAEETYLYDLVDTDQVVTEIHKLCQKVGARLRTADMRAKSVALKLRTPDFTTLSRSRVLPGPTDVARELFGTARELWTEFERAELDGRGLRLLGVRAEKLSRPDDAPEQLTLDTSERDPGWAQAERAIDQLVSRYGAGALRPAALLRRNSGGQDGPATRSSTPTRQIIREEPRAKPPD